MKQFAQFILGALLAAVLLGLLILGCGLLGGCAVQTQVHAKALRVEPPPNRGAPYQAQSVPPQALTTREARFAAPVAVVPAGQWLEYTLGPTNIQRAQACDGSSSRPSTNWWVVYSSPDLVHWQVFTQVMTSPIRFRADQPQQYFTVCQSNSVLGNLFPNPPPL